MKIYTYDNFYIYSGIIEVSAESAEAIQGTPVAVPSVELDEKEAFRFNSVANIWDIVQDMVGTEYIDNGQLRCIYYVGQVLPENAVIVHNIADWKHLENGSFMKKTLSDHIEEKKRSISIEESSIKHFYSLTINKEVHCDQETLAILPILLSSIEEQDKSTVSYRCYDNTHMELTATQLKNLQKEIFEYLQSIKQKKWNIRDTIIPSILASNLSDETKAQQIKDLRLI